MRRIATRIAGGEGPLLPATKKPGLAGLRYILIKLAPRDGLDKFVGNEFEHRVFCDGPAGVRRKDAPNSRPRSRR